MHSPDVVVLGHLSLDAIETLDTHRSGMLGGGALYAALAAQASGASVGLVAAVAEDFPVARLESTGLDLRGLFPVSGTQRRTLMQYAQSGDRTTPAHARAEWWTATLQQ